METKNYLKVFNDLWGLIQTPFLKLNDAEISVVTLTLAIIIVIISLQLAKKLSHLTKYFLNAKNVDSGVSDSLAQFVKIITILLGIVLSLNTLGFSLNSLAAISAVLMVGIGFGLQNIAQNFISGLIILIERPIKVGDIIQVGTTTGKVLDIKVRSTIVQTRDDISIIVPNSKLIAEEVTNQSFSSSNIRLHIDIGVAYGSDLELVKEILLTVAQNHPEILKDPATDVIFKGFGSSSLDFDLRVWTYQIWEQERVCSEIRFEIDKMFRDKHVQIPFPQQDVYIKQLPQQH